MTLPLMSPIAGVKVAKNPIVGIDLSTIRIAGALVTAGGMAWSTRSLQRHKHLGMRSTMAADDIADYLEKLTIDHGLPAACGLEVPLAGTNTPLPSFWMVGAFYVAAGDVWGARVPIVEMGPGAWKLPATGRGIAANLPRAGKGASKVERSRIKTRRSELEKGRIMSWARDVMGYPGTLQDEADATGVVVAQAIRWARSRR